LDPQDSSTHCRKGDNPRRIRFPKCIELRALGERYVVSQRLDGGSKVIERKSEIMVPRSSLWPSGLHQWLIAKGKRELSPWLEKAARQTGHTFTRVRIRRQKTRWGSCSNKGTISLNCKLLFLPADLVRMVLVHELCHTVVPDHSSRFWARLETFFPGAKRMDKLLSGAWRYVPLWADEHV
ncbi:MAG: M48 family metallopeptidase, partial [Desulfovibrionales bacterium]